MYHKFEENFCRIAFFLYQLRVVLAACSRQQVRVSNENAELHEQKENGKIWKISTKLKCALILTFVSVDCALSPNPLVKGRWLLTYFCAAVPNTITVEVYYLFCCYNFKFSSLIWYIYYSYPEKATIELTFSLLCARSQAHFYSDKSTENVIFRRQGKNARRSKAYVYYWYAVISLVLIVRCKDKIDAGCTGYFQINLATKSKQFTIRRLLQHANVRVAPSQ